MTKKTDSLTYLTIVLGLVIGGIIITSIITAVKNSGAPTDIRAKAGVTNTVHLTGVVTDTNLTDGTMTVANVEIAKESRSGPAVNYQTWIVTPPRSYSLASVTIGSRVTFVISAASFDVEKRNVIASDVYNR